MQQIWTKKHVWNYPLLKEIPSQNQKKGDVPKFKPVGESMDEMAWQKSESNRHPMSQPVSLLC